MRKMYQYSGQARFLKKEVGASKTSDGNETKIVRGFASMEGIDRQGDDINPKLFDLDTFLGGAEKAGALYVNHQLWRQPPEEGGNEVSAGVVREAHAAKVMVSENDDEYKIVDLETGDQIDTIPRDDSRVVEEGDIGLWVKAEIFEPGVIKLVDQGRLNAFSWAGDMMKSGLIDLMEVSLVYVGANARALVYSKNLTGDGPVYLVKQKGVYVEGNLEDDQGAFELADVENQGPMYAILKQHSHGEQEVYALQSKNLDDAQYEFFGHLYESGFYGRVALLKNTFRRNGEGPVFEVLDDFTRKYAAKGNHWTEVYINNLPDTAFAYIEKGGQMDEDDRTTPRSLRHFPIKDHRGEFDKGRVRDAIAVLKHHPFAEQAGAHLKAAAAELGLECPDIQLEGGEADMTNEEVESAFGQINETLATMTEVLKGMQAPAAEEEEASVEEESVETKAAEEPEVEKSEEPEATEEGEEIVSAIKGLKAEIADLKKSLAAPKKATKKPMKSKAIDETDEDGTTRFRERENEVVGEPLEGEERTKAQDSLLSSIFQPAQRAGADAFQGDPAVF